MDESRKVDILIADDSAVMRKIIAKTIRLSGLPAGEILEAENGAQALERLAGRKVDLALVDLNMPVMDGEEFIDRLRASPDWRDTLIIVVSTESSDERVVSLEAKTDGFVHKPFGPEELRDAIFKTLGIKNETGNGNCPQAGGPADF